MQNQLQGKNAVVTGGTAGIGRETVRALARQGARVLFTGRNAAAGETLIAEIQGEIPGADVAFLQVDFASLRSVQKLAGEIAARLRQIDILVNNAGLNASKESKTEDGIETVFAVNHLAPFLLTNLLLSNIRDGGRIVNVASKMHSWRSMNFDDLEGRKKWSSITAYSQSKLANVMFTYQLAEKLAARKITVNCLHPGVIASDITRDMPGFVRFLAGVFLKNTEQGAATSVYLAASPEVAGITGKYFDDKKAVTSSKESYAVEKQRRLWAISEAMVKAYL
ncbi:MAG: SDR family oxidoreductase [Spirochaetes bacterium]|nr:SDR family oxidoreductase [Spirochaetota bacterium]